MDVAARQRGSDQRQYLVPRVGPPRRDAQADVLIDGLKEIQPADEALITRPSLGRYTMAIPEIRAGNSGGRIMRIGRLWLIPALWAALMFACNNDGPKPVSESSAAVTATPAMSARGEIEQKVIPAATPDIQSARAQLSSFGGSVQGLLNPHPGQSSLEEIVLESEVIAKVDYLRRISSVQRDDWWWAALLEFRFEVHEYLKGSGPDEIGAFVFYHYETEAAARRAAPLLAAAHDARWDDREEVVFLNYIAEHIAPEGIQLGAGQFWLAGRVQRGWLRGLVLGGERRHQVVAPGRHSDRSQRGVGQRQIVDATEIHA